MEMFSWLYGVGLGMGFDVSLVTPLSPLLFDAFTCADGIGAFLRVASAGIEMLYDHLSSFDRKPLKLSVPPVEHEVIPLPEGLGGRLHLVAFQPLHFSGGIEPKNGS